jgi:hypothetical protein
MKKFNIYLIMLAVLLGGVLVQPAYARKPSAEKTPDMKQLTKLVRETVTYPGFKLNATEESATIMVLFKLTDEGKIDVMKVTGPSKRVEDYIKSILSDLPAKGILHPYNQVYSVKLRFLES